MTSNIKNDNLKEDPVIYSQQWSVLSIFNPKDKVTDKTIFYVNNFLCQEINKTISAQSVQMIRKLNNLINTNFKNKLKQLKDSVNEDDQRLHSMLNDIYQETSINEDNYIDECRRLYSLDTEEILARYKTYLIDNREKLDSEFSDLYDNVCSSRAIKNRGNYGSYKEAEERAREMRNFEEAHDVFVAPVGKWCPIDFEPDEIQNQEYMNKELNDLMGKYNENIKNKNKFFEERKKEFIENAELNKTEKIKQRLQEKLRQKKNNLMKQQLEEIKGNKV